MRLPVLILQFAATLIGVIGVCLDQPEGHANATRNPPWATSTGSDRYGRWADVVVACVTQRMHWIFPGTFTMGSAQEEWRLAIQHGMDASWLAGEEQHLVVIENGFWLGETTCTQGLWVAIRGKDPSYFTGEAGRPVECESWYDASAFLADLSNLYPESQCRLPTGAEWEYACRAGTTGPYHGNELESLGWYKGNSGGTTHPVKQKNPNAWGLYDMHGHVWVWCADHCGHHPYTTAGDRTGEFSGNGCAYRGGSWCYMGEGCRSGFRNGAWQGDRVNAFACRLCIPAQPESRP